MPLILLHIENINFGPRFREELLCDALSWEKLYFSLLSYVMYDSRKSTHSFWYMSVGQNQFWCLGIVCLLPAFPWFRPYILPFFCEHTNASNFSSNIINYIIRKKNFDKTQISCFPTLIGFYIQVKFISLCFFFFCYFFAILCLSMSSPHSRN